MAFGESTLTGDWLRPALVPPPAESDGEFDASALTEKLTFGSPTDCAVMVTAPGLLPSVTIAVTVPSLSVRAGEGVTVAAPSGLTGDVTNTPGTPASASPVTFSTRGAGKPAPTIALWPLPLTMFMLAALTTCGVSSRTWSLK